MRTQFYYSSVISSIGSGFVTKYYYPAADRNSTAVTIENGAIGMGAIGLGNLFKNSSPAD